jgi:hypothetical protein
MHSEALVSAMCAALIAVFAQQSCERQRDKPDVILSGKCHRIVDLKEFPELRTSIPKANANRPEVWRRWGEYGDAAMMKQWGAFQRMYLFTLTIGNRNSMPCQLDDLRITGIRRRTQVKGLKAVTIGDPYVTSEDFGHLELSPTLTIDANGKETFRVLVIATIVPTTDAAADLLHRQSLKVLSSQNPNATNATDFVPPRLFYGNPDEGQPRVPFVIPSVLSTYYDSVKIESLRFSLTDSLGRTHESESIVLNE